MKDFIQLSKGYKLFILDDNVVEIEFPEPIPPSEIEYLEGVRLEETEPYEKITGRRGMPEEVEQTLVKIGAGNQVLEEYRKAVGL